jgi:hypothetical protein
MSSLGSPNPFFIAGKKAYEVKRSLRLNNDDSAYLDRTPSSAGNRRTMTLSLWVKGMIGGTYQIFDAHQNDSNRSRVFFNDNGSISFFHRPGDTNCHTTPLYRDPSAWYHIVFAFDMTQASASNRYKVYINGVEQANDSNIPAQNTDLFFNTTNSHKIGAGGDDQGNEGYFDGYMAEINFLDGYAYDPSYFGETDSVTGQWNPKKYIGSYGTNGFYLNFSDNSGTTATTLGKDYSGNGNNFTPNNFSVSAGESNDSLEDTPTNNFPTINPLDGGTNALLTNGNLTFKPNSSNGGNFNVFYSTFSMRSGKWYFEVLIVNENSGTNSIQFGIGSYKYKRDSTNQNGYPGTSGLTFLNVNNSNSTYRIGVVDGSSVGSSVSTASTNDVYGIAFDADNKKVYFYKNGSAEGESSGYNVTDVGTGDFFFFSTLRYSTGGSYTGGEPTLAVNFGQRAFSYTAPTGYKKLNSANLPNPTIKLPNQHFNTLLYTGNDSSDRDITGVGFQPDWLWIKNRQQADWHQLCDAVRGANKVLFSNTTDGESTDNSNGHVNSFLADGFNVDAGAGGNVNENNENYVAWNWNAGDTDGKTYAVTVVSDSGNKYRFDGFGTSAVTLDLAEGGTYVFDWSDSSAQGHPIRFSTTSDGTHGGGSEYTTGVTKDDSAYKTTITVAASAPQLYYYCQNHSGMGGAINTNSTLGSSNFDGTIQTRVKANTTAGFSIVTYTGNNASATIGHGLGVAPNAVIIKRRNGTGDWIIGHDGLASNAFANNKFLKYDTSGTFTNSLVFGSQPTSSVVQIVTGSGATNLNGSSDTYVAYCFSEVASFSKFGSFIGNGSSDGTFVSCNFRPAWILIRSTSSGRHWVMNDSARNPHNVANKTFLSNASNAEDSGSSFQIDILSNGFKCRTDGVHVNTNGGTHIFFAFAESPFKYARAR